MCREQYLVEGLERRVLLSADLFVVNGGANSIGEYTTSGATVNAALISGLDFPFGIAISAPLATVSGTVYTDKNGDGVRERKERGLGGITVTLQPTKRGKPKGRAVSTTSNSGGAYAFTNLTAGSYQISETAPRRARITQPLTGTYAISLVAAQDLTAKISATSLLRRRRLSISAKGRSRRPLQRQHGLHPSWPGRRPPVRMTI